MCQSVVKVIRRLGFILLSVGASFLFAGEADVIAAKVVSLGGDQYRIDTTIKHNDSGWSHYANAWDVLDESGTVLGTRTLFHPHVNEQPFTRSLTLSIPNSVKNIQIRAQDSEHGYGGKTIFLTIPK